MGERAVKHVRKFLGQRLRALRKQRALSQERLGDRSGLSGKFIGEVERGEKSISIDSLYRVSVARSEEHTSELQSRLHLVCRLLLSRPPSSTLFPYTTLFRSMGERAVKHVRKFLGQRLRALRKQRALSQERLGDRSGLSGKFIGEVERGEKSISIDSLYRVSVA